MRRINNLIRLVDNSYTIVTKILPIFNYQNPHSYLMLRNNQKGKITFNGTNICGIYSMILGIYLREMGYHTTFHYYSGHYYSGHNNKGFMNHIYLKYNNNIIIDPTWRQFFGNRCMFESEYTEYIYKTMPFYFVGDIYYLEKSFNLLNDLYSKRYNHTLNKDLLNIWKNTREIKFIENNPKYEKIIVDKLKIFN